MPCYIVELEELCYCVSQAKSLPAKQLIKFVEFEVILPTMGSL